MRSDNLYMRSWQESGRLDQAGRTDMLYNRSYLQSGGSGQESIGWSTVYKCNYRAGKLGQLGNYLCTLHTYRRNHLIESLGYSKELMARLRTCKLLVG